ncbi:hypothetical protein EIN_005160 [Entamoeba invadens IP1]|uniref:Helitron helicase-like domain-containing protein n=1 Tax=Entamoeba invadens IP1 TaxID=370355 RepID=A0A0A1UGS9_ENTIV|nr:hypothetical protein EIN_005160 [Entamoeba invadens IP1]ELP93655.1 hypothetical protein EIN_005160 [Entamoeba invadens IP1]|eukprot:XP_004260426.1 hypothetical protein EIN_005160 [Entamoeba invadens IP1]
MRINESSLTSVLVETQQKDDEKYEAKQEQRKRKKREIYFKKQQTKQPNYKAKETQQQIIIHDCGVMNIKCSFCGAFHFKAEKSKNGSFRQCCHYGKVLLPKLLDIPKEKQYEMESLLNELYNVNNVHYKSFKTNIRAINSSLSFVSFGANIKRFTGVANFTVEGQVYHSISVINTEDDKRAFVQYYIIDSELANTERLEDKHNKTIDPFVIESLDREIRKVNPIAKSFIVMGDIIKTQPKDTKVTLEFVRDKSKDERRFNTPTSNEIAIVFINHEHEGKSPFNRDIVVRSRQTTSQPNKYTRITTLSPYIDPMCYTLLFPFGNK